MSERTSTDQQPSTVSNDAQASATLGLNTQIIHAPVVGGEGFTSQAVPIYRGSSTFFTNTAAQRAGVNVLGRDYSYGLHGNPTRYTLSERLARIEGAKHCTVVPSGLAAITLVASTLLRTGDHWLIPHNAYGPVINLAEQLKAAYGISFDLYDPMDVTQTVSLFRSETRLLWIESPGSLTFECPDLAELVALARSRDAYTCIDNTWSAGLTLKPFELGIDLSIQALTKYQCGHADVVLGAVLGCDDSLFTCIHRQMRLMGLTVSSYDCEAVLRGLLTLPLRYHQQAESGRVIANTLDQWKSRLPIQTILHPEWAECPGHKHFTRYFTGSASVFAFAFTRAVTDEQAVRVVDGLKLFRIAYSWGGPESLALVANISDTRRSQLKCGPIIRLAVGLETTSDLVNDLENSMNRVFI